MKIKIEEIYSRTMFPGLMMGNLKMVCMKNLWKGL